MVSMNRLSVSDRARVIATLVEGNSIRSTVRLTGVAKNTVTKLIVEMGNACVDFHDARVRNLKSKRVQCDEIWSFVGAKQRNATEEQKAQGWGDAWTWTAIDADSKLMVSWFVGQRDAETARIFMHDAASRITNRIQITTDGLGVYLSAIEDAFGDVDYAILNKIYTGAGAGKTSSGRYSPAKFMGATRVTVKGNPDAGHISTSFVERSNLTMRMHMRRFTRLTNGFSKKLENHSHAVALFFTYYNFCKVHQTLRVTPAMEAGLSDHVWSIEELVGLLESVPKQAA